MMFFKDYRHLLILMAVSLLLQSCALTDKKQRDQLLESGRAFINGTGKQPLSDQDIAEGLKEALKVGSERVVAQVGKSNGYLNDKSIHIELPANIQKVHDTLSKVGLGKHTKELEVKMNRAAEVAAPKAKQLFWVAIKEMRWQDVQAIYKGNDDAATQYFKSKMTPELKKMMRPVIDDALADVGVVKTYNKVLTEYEKIPFMPKVQFDLTGYVMDKGIHGIFFYLAKEEAQIRKDPLKRTTEILKRVFGG